MFGRRSGSGKVADSHHVEGNLKDGLPQDKSSVVGIPDTHTKTATTTYKDANITSGTKQMAVGEVKEGVETGQAIGSQEEVVKVPREVRSTETITVPEVTMQKQTVEMPETKVVQEERVVKGYEMRPETVTREEVVLEQKEVPHPTTELRRVEAEKPVLKEREVMIARPNEIMRKVKVVRPETRTETVTAYRPVERKRTVTVQRPTLVKRTVKQKQPVETVDLVNVTQPEIQEATMDVQVPVTETRSVEYTAAVTQIRPTEDAKIEQQAEDAKRDPSSSDREPIVSSESQEEQEERERDWSTIPVGLPFTELQKRTKQFDVTSIKPEVANVRQTWMKTVQVEKKGYKFEEVEFEITETEMRDFEESVVETVLEPYEKEVEVTVMREVVEQWPVTKGREESVTTSEVTLEPTSAMMPQVGSKLMTVDEPRTVTIHEQIEKPHEVERTEVVDKSVTEMKQVEVERPVEGTKQVQVEKVDVVYDDKVITNPVTEHKEEVQHGKETVQDDSVEYSQKDAQYRQAGTHIDPTKLDQEHVVDPATQKVDVKDEKIASAHKIGVQADDVAASADDAKAEPERKQKGLFGTIADVLAGQQ